MQVKVLSWNIWVNNNFELVKDFLAKFDADIIGLQEVSGNDESRDTVSFLKELGYQGMFFPQVRPWAGNGRSDGPAIFSKYPIIASNKYVLSEKFGVGAVQADIKLGQQIVHFFSTHLSHTHQHESSDQMAQISILLKNIAGESSVLMGDFNAIPTGRTIRKIKEKLVDTDPHNSPTWSMYPDGCEVCKPQKINIRLDYIFTSKGIQTHSYKVEYSKGSDHLPISLILEPSL